MGRKRHLWLSRVFWQPDGGGDGGNPDPTPGDNPPKTFTQEEVNVFVAERAKHARSSAVSDLLKELGFEKADELKAAVQRQRETENANKTELQKAQSALAEYQKKEQTWAQEKRAQALQIAVQGASAKLGIEAHITGLRNTVQATHMGKTIYLSSSSWKFSVHPHACAVASCSSRWMAGRVKRCPFINRQRQSLSCTKGSQKG